MFDLFSRIFLELGWRINPSGIVFSAAERKLILLRILSIWFDCSNWAGPREVLGIGVGFAPNGLLKHINKFINFKSQEENQNLIIFCRRVLPVSYAAARCWKHSPPCRIPPGVLSTYPWYWCVLGSPWSLYFSLLSRITWWRAKLPPLNRMRCKRCLWIYHEHQCWL